MTTDTAYALLQLAKARELIDAANAVFGAADLPPGHAAGYAKYTEEIDQSLSRAKIRAAHALRHTGAHKLDQASFQHLGEAFEQPTPQSMQDAAGRTITGRTDFRNTRSMMHDWLDIPRGTASDRLILADCLLGGVDDSGQPTAPWLPELAAEYNDPTIDPRLVMAASTKLHSARKDLGEGAAANAKKAKLERESVAFMHAEPKSARKHISAMVAEVKAGQRPLKALLESIGIFKKGLRQGLIEYVLRVLPSQAAYIEAFFASIDNPATVAGNREGLKDAEAQFTGEQVNEWDDGASMPDWAQSEAEHEESADDSQHPDTSDAEATQSSSQETTAEDSSEAEADEQPEHRTASASWEDLKPERRRLVGLMTLLMSDRTGSPPHRKLALATPQVSIILNYEKMLAQAKDFAVTSSGIQLSAGEARAALCNSGIYPVVLNGKSLPLDLGRTQRLYSKAQRRAIRAAYRGCSYPGCSMPAERCEIDHLDAWEKGGRTDIKSAGLSCLIHHTGRHCGLFHAVKIPGSRPMVLLSPELDPEQKLRINTYFMTPAEALEAQALADETTAKWRAGQLEVEIVDP
ncbi:MULTISPECIES: HNH endonuclease signature motif containing protein [Glutamicibacter]|uniref:HNH endonuclease signature motif containing protein n=1 Tax=Glutamicibacter TaxID=1742989 RepID=UPI000ECD86F0|nr:HNH endonuclease signature motif containing protein [Glutamicibacter sp.]HCJ54881.1 HNH endonuclease [Glutamicibacter sp.]HCM95955.1 HNH endonuclease [Glutamicibacter sp.]